jgi:acyl-coenzyme A synthetase/AMP-(fatty) acid ligase
MRPTTYDQICAAHRWDMPLRYNIAADVCDQHELADEIRRFVRDGRSAYAYPRHIEFVAELPKTLTGKIRRIELRQLELDRVAAGAES